MKIKQTKSKVLVKIHKNHIKYIFYRIKRSKRKPIDPKCSTLQRITEKYYYNFLKIIQNFLFGNSNQTILIPFVC